jgi:hypothetical protein
VTPPPASLTAIAVLALLLSGCAVVNPGGSGLASIPVSDATRTRASTSVGAEFGTTEVDAALDATAAAGAAHFRTDYALSAEKAGYFQTMTKSDGTIDLAASRGVAIKEDYPGQATSTTSEVALVGDRLFSRPEAGATWEDRSGGARSFIGLDVPGDSALAVVKTALSGATSWTVVASDPADPRGSIRVQADGGTADLNVVIDAAGRLVSVVRRSIPSKPGGGRNVYELTFTEFGVPRGFDAPG